MIRIHCQGGVTLTGETLDTIGRREFGPKAFFRQSQNPNDGTVGKYLVPNKYDPRAYWVCAIVMQTEEI